MCRALQRCQAGNAAHGCDAGLTPLVPGDNDIDQLGRVISTFGSMEPVWPGVRALPDWGKIAFPPAEPKPLRTLIPGARQSALDFAELFLK